MGYREERAEAVASLQAALASAERLDIPGWVLLPLAGMATVLFCAVTLLFAIGMCLWRWVTMVITALITPLAILRMWVDMCMVGVWFLDAITTKWTEKA